MERYINVTDRKVQRLPPKCRVEGKNVSQNSNTHDVPQGSGLWRRESTRKGLCVKPQKSFYERNTNVKTTKRQSWRANQTESEGLTATGSCTLSLADDPEFTPITDHPTPRLQVGEVGLRAIHQPGAITPSLSERQSLWRIPARCVSIRPLRSHISLTWTREGERTTFLLIIK